MRAWRRNQDSQLLSCRATSTCSAVSVTCRICRVLSTSGRLTFSVQERNAARSGECMAGGPRLKGPASGNRRGAQYQSANGVSGSPLVCVLIAPLTGLRGGTGDGRRGVLLENRASRRIVVKAPVRRCCACGVGYGCDVTMPSVACCLPRERRSSPRASGVSSRIPG